MRRSDLFAVRLVNLVLTLVCSVPLVMGTSSAAQENVLSATLNLQEDPGPTVAADTLLQVTATLTGTMGTPTGAVNYSLDGTGMESANLVGGVATFTLPGPLAQGAHSVSVSYNGDKTYTAPSVSQGFTLNVLPPGSATPPSFAVSTSSESGTVSAGGESQFLLTLTPVGGYAGTFNYTCTGNPSATICSFSDLGPPFTISQNSRTVTLGIVTNSPVSQRFPPAHRPLLALGLFGSSAWAGVFVNRKRPRYLWRRHVLFLLSLSLLCAITDVPGN